MIDHLLFDRLKWVKDSDYVKNYTGAILSRDIEAHKCYIHSDGSMEITDDNLELHTGDYVKWFIVYKNKVYLQFSGKKSANWDAFNYAPLSEVVGYLQIGG